MPVDQTQAFIIGGLPILYSQIEEWYENYKNTTPKNKISIPDPYYSEKACWFIAKIIVDKINKKSNSQIFPTTDVEQRITPVEKTSLIKSNENDYIYGSTEDVIKKAFEELERKFKLKQEQIKQNEELRRSKNADFWKSQPVEKPKVSEKSFREILGLDRNIILTEKVIKSAYYKQAIKCHPDTGGSDAKFKELLDARDLAYKSIGKE